MATKTYNLKYLTHGIADDGRTRIILRDEPLILCLRGRAACGTRRLQVGTLDGYKAWVDESDLRTIGVQT